MVARPVHPVSIIIYTEINNFEITWLDFIEWSLDENLVRNFEIAAR